MADDELRILVVCTANQCRSPLAAASFRRHTLERGVPAVVESAGISAIPGFAATPPTIEAGARIGLDLYDHTTTPLEYPAIERADLVIGLERRHVQEIVLADRGAFARTFTLRELARRGANVGPREPGEPLAAWLTRVHDGRRPMDLLGTSADDDVADPTGSAMTDHRTAAEEIDALVADVVALITPQ